MTKQRAIKELVRLGWSITPSDRPSLVWAVRPGDLTGRRHLVYPADLLAEVREQAGK